MDTLKATLNGTTLLVHFAGELTLRSSSTLREKLQNYMDAHTVEHLVIDLSQVEFIDSSGIGMLVALKTRLTSNHKSLFLLSPSPQVQSTIALVHLGSFFQILDSDDDVLAIIPD